MDPQYLPITCASASFCTYLPDTSYPTSGTCGDRPSPIWDGGERMLITAAPNPTEPHSASTSVSCPAPTTAWRGPRRGRRARGRHGPTVGRPALDAGGRAARPAGHDLDLRTVSCSEPNDCVAVGATAEGAGAPRSAPHIYGKLYVARDDGRTWTDESAGLPRARGSPPRWMSTARYHLHRRRRPDERVA